MSNRRRSTAQRHTRQVRHWWAYVASYTLCDACRAVPTCDNCPTQAVTVATFSSAPTELGALAALEGHHHHYCAACRDQAHAESGLPRIEFGAEGS